MSQQGTKKDPITCTICGKLLTRKQSQDNEMGHRCDTLIAQGWTGEKLRKHQAAQTVDTVPDGYVKVATFKKLVKDNVAKIPGLTVTKVVNALGKDRGVEPPAHPIAKPVYDARRTRWVDPWLASKAGLTAIATGDFSKAPK